MRSTARDKAAASLHRHRAELHHPALAAARRQSPRGVLHPRPRSHQLPLRAQPGRPAHQPRADAGGGCLRQRAEGSRHRLRPPPAGSRRLPWQADRDKQTKTLITYTENRVTNADRRCRYPDDYRTPLPCETRTYELTGYPSDRRPQAASSVADFVQSDGRWPDAHLRHRDRLRRPAHRAADSAA